MLPKVNHYQREGPPARGWWPARGQIVLLVVALLLLRLPFLQHPTPVHPDEVGFVAGIGFPSDNPVHPPGFPLWVALGNLLHRLGLGPYAAYQVWSVAASVVGPALLYVGLRRLICNDTAWWLALAFGVNPLLWFQSATALTYAGASAVGLLVVGLCYQAVLRGRERLLLWASLALCLGLFLRGDMLLYLGPVFAYAAWRLRKRGGLWTLILPAAACLALYGLTVFLYSRGGGASAGVRFAHTRDVILGTSVFRLGLVDGLLRNAVKMVVNVAWDMGLAVLLLIPACWVVWRRRRERGEVVVFLLLWLLPGGLLLLCMHVVQGYFLLLLPGAYVILGVALEARCAAKTAARTAAVVAILSAGQFLFYPWSAESTGFKRLVDAKIAFQSAAGLRHIDLRERIHHQGDYWRTPAHDQTESKGGAGS